jgi:hypothetical protein
LIILDAILFSFRDKLMTLRILPVDRALKQGSITSTAQKNNERSKEVSVEV